jgi:hypothetical protein
MSVSLEVAIGAEVAVAAVVVAVVAVVDAAEIDVAVFLPRLDGTLAASVALVAAIFFFFPLADIEVADDVGALVFAAHVGRELLLEVEEAM